MRNHLLFNVVIFLFFCLLNVTFCNAQRVLILGVDGLRSDAVEVANTPNIDNLIANGLYSPDALNDDITISGPGWSAILCGVWSDKHLVTGNNFTINDYAEFPSLFKRIESYNNDLNTTSICHWGPINDEIIDGDSDMAINLSSDFAVAIEAANQLTNDNPHVMFLHFDDGDYAGHGNGFSPSIPAYVSAIEGIDLNIGIVLSNLQARPNFNDEDWIILLTSDHGGINFNHGGNSLVEQNVPFIVSGNSVTQSVVEKDSIYVLSSNCLQDDTELVFDGDNDYVEINNSSIFNFGSNQDFTIECRVKTDFSGDVSIVGNKDWDSGSFKGFVFSFKFPSGPEWKVNIGDGSNRADINTGGLIADNEWHTLSVSFDRDGFMKMYEDGVFIAQTSITNIGDINTFEPLVFGTDINQAYDFSGSIAEVRVWNKVITAQEINNFYCNRINLSHPSYSNLIGYWHMNEGIGNQVIDQSLNSNDGTIYQANWADSDTIWNYDYSNTPRIADISLTAFGHLCLPVNSNWQLDGKSWVPDCVFGLNDCVNPGINRWVGPSIGNWHLANNWSQQRIPLICDQVIIPENHQVSISNNTSAECYSLCVETNAELIVPASSNLDVLQEP